MKIFRKNNQYYYTDIDRSESNLEELFYDLNNAIDNNKRYGQLEKLEVKVNILFSLLLTQIQKKPIEKTLIQFVNNESDNITYEMDEENEN